VAGRVSHRIGNKKIADAIDALHAQVRAGHVEVADVCRRQALRVKQVRT
jgi:hypothetical protein